MTMNEALLARLNVWLVEAGLAGVTENERLRGCCERAAAAGLPLSRAIVVVDTLHPIHEGRVFRWRLVQTEEREVVEYGRLSEDPQAAESWMRSPFRHLLETGGSL